MLELEKAKNLISNTDNIDILPSIDLKKDSFPASLALYYSLRKLGKNVNLVTETEPETYSFLVEKEKLQPAHRADFLISIKEKNLKLSQLFYEKTSQGLNLFLKTNGQQINKNNIDLKSLRDDTIDPEEDGLLVIAVGLEDLKLISRSYQPLPQIIFLGQQEAKQDLGQINFIEKNSSSFSEIAYDLICGLDQSLLDSQIANALLAGIIEQAAGLQNPKLNAASFNKVSCLLEAGANLKLITTQLYGMMHRNAMRIFGRVLSKIEVDNKKDIAWVALRGADFKKTNSSPADLKFTFRKLSSGLFPFNNFLCLYEQTNSPTEIFGVFYSLDNHLLEKVSSYFHGASKGHGLLFKSHNNNLLAAKKEVFELL
jgi:hypothetical protein